MIRIIAVRIALIGFPVFTIPAFANTFNNDTYAQVAVDSLHGVNPGENRVDAGGLPKSMLGIYGVLDFPGSFGAHTTLDSKFGFGLGLEGIYRFRSFGIGFATEVQLPRRIKDAEMSFNFMSLYALTRVVSNPEQMTTNLYLGFRFGINRYSETSADDDFGLCYAVDAGIIIKGKVETGFSYQLNSFYIYKSTYKYSRISFRVGVLRYK